MSPNPKDQAHTPTSSEPPLVARSQGLRETMRIAFYALALALIIRTFFLEPFSIPSGSMLPTLRVGDYLFVSKWSYGYSRYALPFALPIIPGRLASRLPKRGDVVVFKLPRDNKTDYIKRVIGLPGDRVQIVQGRVIINGALVPREPVDKDKTLFRDHQMYEEKLPQGRKHLILERGDHEPLSDNTAVYHVPDNHIFVMGDNRDSSQDSRFTSAVGMIPLVNLVGRARFLFFSRARTTPLWKFWSWPATIRWSRIADRVR